MKYAITLAAGLALSAVAANANPATPKLHPIKEVCITYEWTGQMMNGSSVRCHRDYGYETYEIEDMTVGIAGFSQAQKEHRVIIGDTIYAIDTAANTGTKTKNPMYDQMVEAVKKGGPEDVTKVFLDAMSFEETGEQKTVAGKKCTVHTSPLITEACLSDKALILEQNVMGNVMRATSISFNAGEAKNYRRHESATITDGPDLSEEMEGMDALEALEGLQGLEGLQDLNLGDLFGRQE